MGILRTSYSSEGAAYAEVFLVEVFSDEHAFLYQGDPGKISTIRSRVDDPEADDRDGVDGGVQGGPYVDDVGLVV